MKSSRPNLARGAALLALLAVISLGASWFLVSRLNAESTSASADRKTRNTAVLNRAKQALIGYIAAQAVKAGENNPGALPCPEAAGYYGDAAQEGQVASSCTLPKVGRFPWRTIGTEKLVDAYGEPLWYVVSPSWGRTGSNTNINSNTPGGLSVDASANEAVALIIAPGPAFSAPTATGCTAWNQTRPSSGTLDWRNYLECGNATTPPDATLFVTTGPSGAFNDQVVKITAAELLPAIEAAIAKRIELEILPALKTVYTPGTWGFTGSNPILPFAAPFASPGPGAGTSDYRGTTGTNAGLLPFNQTQGCTESASEPRCTTATTGGTALFVFSKPVNDVFTGSGSIRTQSSCSWVSTAYVCTGEYLQPSISVTVTINVTNVAVGLRTLNLSNVICTAMNDTGGGIGTQTVPCVASVALQSNGSATFTVATSALPDIVGSGWGTYANYRVSIDRAAVGDHPLLDSTDATTGWFVRNEWYRLLYYAVSPSNTAARLSAVSPAERSCTLVGDCLTVTNMTPSSAKSALLVLAGRSVNGRSRPSAIRADYFEFGNASAAYEHLTVTPATTAIYADTGAANAYAIPVASIASGAILQLRAQFANTGSSSLNTAATGTQSLVNADGSNLAAAAILANAAVQVTWDGTRFRLAKRPFNDRVVAIDSN